jgi:hypothetical protein
MPRESLDASKNLPEQTRRQVAFGELQDEGPGMPDEASAGLDEPLPETRRRPTLDEVPAQHLPDRVCGRFSSA